MALSATFSADFTSFEKAVDSATSKVLSFEAGSSKVKASLERMESSLSGKKLIQDATLAAEAVERIGGASFLTEAELQRLGAQAEEATEKMKLMGIDVPPEIEKITLAARAAATETGNLGTVGTTTSTKFGTLAKEARNVDGSLRAVGVNVGPVINVLDELSNASGKTVGALGKLGTAGAVLSAAVGGWQIGRKISEMFDLDKKIGDFTAKLLGWGDVAGQEAAAGADVLARASANAGRQITNMTEAMQINTDAVRKAQEPIKSTAVDMDKLREGLLKAEAEYRGLPPKIDAVSKSATNMGEATVRAATSSAGSIRLMADGLDDVQRRMNAIVQADKEKAAADRAATAAANAASVTRQIVGRVTPLSEREAANMPALEQAIATLTRKLAGAGPIEGAGAGVAAAAQQRADDERQLEYLRTLLDVASALARSAESRQTSPVNVTVQASGFFDPAAKRQLAAAISDELMSTLKLGRQLGAG